MDNVVKLRVMLAYKNNVPVFDMGSFQEDYMRFTYILKQLTLYKTSGKINLRLVLNHLIIVYNVFGNSATEILFDKASDNSLPQLCTLLDYLSKMPQEDFTTLSGVVIKPSCIKPDDELFLKIEDVVNDN